MGVEERRKARVGTVSGLALLTGGTAIAAVAGGAHSIFATILLGTLTIGLAHSLGDEIRRQAGRRSSGWVVEDTVNAVLLTGFAVGALIVTVLAVVPTTVRAVGLALTIGYAVSCVYFIIERRRAIATTHAPI
jgi:preprotein translocase subunit SecY